ncbi:MAG: DoxX family membrane protein [Roseiflexaceae bacterium]
MVQTLARIDRTLTCWMQRNATTLLRWSMGIIFVWFGALKLVPGLSPADGLIRASMSFLPMEYFIPFLALWEITIGIGFIIGYGMRVTILLLFLQMM